MKIIACAKQVIVVNRPKRDHRKELNCADCFYSKNAEDGKKVCTLFKYLTISEDIFYVDTIYCRSDFNLCGPYADFFKARK